MKGHNNFWNKILFYYSWGFLRSNTYIRTIRIKFIKLFLTPWTTVNYELIFFGLTRCSAHLSSFVWMQIILYQGELEVDLSYLLHSCFNSENHPSFTFGNFFQLKISYFLLFFQVNLRLIIQFLLLLLNLAFHVMTKKMACTQM